MFLVFLAQSIEARCSVENEDAVGARSTDDAPTTFAWSIFSLPIIAIYIRGLMVYLCKANKESVMDSLPHLLFLQRVNCDSRNDR